MITYASGPVNAPVSLSREVTIVGKIIAIMNAREKMPAKNGNKSSSLSAAITSRLNFVISQLRENAPITEKELCLLKRVLVGAVSAHFKYP